MLEKSGFRIRNASMPDLAQLLELEKEWPENSRASADQLQIRIEKFPLGFFIAEDETGIIASLIACPYHYQADDLSNYSSWNAVIDKCYKSTDFSAKANALYIVSGTTRKNPYGGILFKNGIHKIKALAESMGKQYITAGALLYGYARYIKQNNISAAEYVFTQSQGRYIDPLIEKYRRLGFHVPDRNHVIPDYFPHADSLNYSALVVKRLQPA